MRLEYEVQLAEIEVPRFAVESVEGIGKLFTLATLILNILDTRNRVEIIFHGLNPEDPERKIAAFNEILGSAETAKPVVFEPGRGGRVSNSSSYFQWVSLRRE
jgi:hypothetical protein